MTAPVNEDSQIVLPPGFRFHPTDEELISHYLCKKVLDSSFSCKPIGEVDLNKSEPWDLPCKIKFSHTLFLFFFKITDFVGFFLVVRESKNGGKGMVFFLLEG